ncbi:GNAT family N-acetyltransferase [Chloroflexi bacterium TSY]|nr:GNAT family N-acetyltransferase [Chloroflexi bacterium TSY]
MTSITNLSVHHASTAAQLHIAGQPGTFLTRLGPDVLTVLYQVLPQSTLGFGFAATGRCHEIQGFVSATTSVGHLFTQLGTRYLGQFLPPLFNRFVRQPTLLFQSIQTVFYPFLARDHHTTRAQSSAELLSIMVEPSRRGQGIGTTLLQALVAECNHRAITALDVTVDAQNRGARRFYERHHFVFQKQFQLYGRTMCLYRRAVLDS